MKRVIAYIDGFNLYYGMKEKKYKRYYWLNVFALANNLLSDKYALQKAKYFTARISAKDKPEKHQRQEVYINALKTVSNLQIIDGHYKIYHQQCPYCDSLQYCYKCKKAIEIHKEKMTDVNIATELVCDSYKNNFDTALLISGDTDLVGAVKAVLREFPQKQIIIAFPPERESSELGRAGTHSFIIGRAKLRDSQLPDPVIKPNGRELTKPAEWH